MWTKCVTMSQCYPNLNPPTHEALKWVLHFEGNDKRIKDTTKIHQNSNIFHLSFKYTSF